MNDKSLAIRVDTSDQNIRNVGKYGKYGTFHRQDGCSVTINYVSSCDNHFEDSEAANHEEVEILTVIDCSLTQVSCPAFPR